MVRANVRSQLFCVTVFTCAELTVWSLLGIQKVSLLFNWWCYSILYTNTIKPLIIIAAGHSSGGWGHPRLIEEDAPPQSCWIRFAARLWPLSTWKRIGFDTWDGTIARGLEYPKRTGQEQKKGTPAESPGRVGTLSNYFFILFVDGLFDWCGRCKLCGLRRDDDNEEGGTRRRRHLAFQEMIDRPLFGRSIKLSNHHGDQIVGQSIDPLNDRPIKWWIYCWIY